MERLPTPEEYAPLIAAVGWRPYQCEAITFALQPLLFAACVEAAGETIGCRLVIDDGGTHLYPATPNTPR